VQYNHQARWCKNGQKTFGYTRTESVQNAREKTKKIKISMLLQNITHAKHYKGWKQELERFIIDRFIMTIDNMAEARNSQKRI